MLLASNSFFVLAVILWKDESFKHRTSANLGDSKTKAHILNTSINFQVCQILHFFSCSLKLVYKRTCLCTFIVIWFFFHVA